VKPQLILFDIDHTLVDVLAFHEPAYTKALREIYEVEVSLRDIEFSGKTTPNIIRELARFRGVADERIEESLGRALDKLAHAIVANLGSDLRENILPGVVDVLRSLRADGITLGIVTGNPRPIGEEVLRRAGLLRYFAVRVFGDEAVERWQLVALAIERAQRLLGWRLEIERVVVIGDSPHDVHAGRAAGAATVALGTGLHHNDDLEASDPDVLLPDLADLRAALDAIIGATARRAAARRNGTSAAAEPLVPEGDASA
jgi:phosphoglycolate phosphatase